MAPAYFLQDAQGAYYPINGPTQIGRDPACQIRLSDPEVSRTHALLWVERQILYLRDEDTRNGTYLNEWRLPAKQAIALASGNQLRFGNSSFTVMTLAPTLPAKSAPEGSATPTPAPQAASSQLPLFLILLALGLCLGLFTLLMVGFFWLRSGAG